MFQYLFRIFSPNAPSKNLHHHNPHLQGFDLFPDSEAGFRYYYFHFVENTENCIYEKMIVSANRNYIATNQYPIK